MNETEDEEGVKDKLDEVYPVFHAPGSSPHLYLFTMDAEMLRVSVYFNGEMQHHEYPKRAKSIILQSLNSCNLLRMLNDVAALNAKHAARNQVN